MSCNEPEISDLLLLLLENNASPEERRRVSDHLACCTQCRKELEELSEVMETVKTEAGKIKQTGEHLSPDEMITYTLFPEEMADARMEQVEKHLNTCNLCRKEVVLIRESPEVSGQDKICEEAVMPAFLMEKFREAYPAQNLTQQEPIKPVIDDAASTNTFWQQIGCIFKPKARFAYILTVFLMFFSFSLGIILSPRIAHQSQDEVTPGRNFLSTGEFVQYPTTGTSNRELGKMVSFLQGQGISAYKYKNEIWIKDTQVKNAFGLLVIYQEQNRASERSRIAGNTTQTSPHHYPVPETTITPGTGGFFTPSVIATSFPVAQETSAVSGTTTVSFPGEEDLFGSHFTNRNGISRTPWDIARPSDAVVLHHEALTTAPSLLASDLEERDVSAEKIRKEFNEQVFSVLDKRSDLRNSLVYTTVSLAFQKNQYDVFPIKGVKITIVTAAPLSSRDRRLIAGDIKSAVNWKEHWDGDIEFTTP
jgi:hypothetical protein